MVSLSTKKLGEAGTMHPSLGALPMAGLKTYTTLRSFWLNHKV